MNTELKYGFSKTHQHKLVNDADLDGLSKAVNTSKGQLYFLYQLCDGDFELLKTLVVKMKNNHVHYCPGDKESVNKVLAMGNGTNWFKL